METLQSHADIIVFKQQILIPFSFDYIHIAFPRATLGELMGELFLPCEMPEPPKQGFFTGLFGGGVRPLDREELCEFTPSFPVLMKMEQFIVPQVFSCKQCN